MRPAWSASTVASSVERGLLGREAGDRQELGDAVAVLLAVRVAAGGLAGHRHLAERVRHRQAGQDDREPQQRGAEVRHPLLEVAEEAEDRDFDQQDDADAHAEQHVRDGPRRHLDLVVPHARDHLAHHHQVDEKVEVTEDPVQPHQRGRRGARAGLLVEREAPQVEHQEHGRHADDEEQDAERSAEDDIHLEEHGRVPGAPSYAIRLTGARS
jgi:hypothetical protein